MKEIRKILPESDLLTALKWLEQAREKVRRELLLGRPQRQRFCDYAISVLEGKMAKGELTTADSHAKWKYTLEHLIAGTAVGGGGLRVTGFGEFFLDEIRPSHVESWKVGIGKLIQAGQYSPKTVNGWLSVLRVVLKDAKRDFELRDIATDGVKNFDTRTHATYTEEEPNALSPEEVPRFLDQLRSLYPQHFAMAYLGFATGLRPSSLRPLRRCGPTPDVLWDAKRLLVRRSHTTRDLVRNTTKQGVRYTISLPEDVVEVLRWHVETQLESDEQRASELLFPSPEGGFRTRTVLVKPFTRVSREIGLGCEFTPRGMRRTFNDLCRAAQVEDLVTRSISGHLTERMQHHYSTVRGDEQRQGIARVIDLMTARSTRPKSASEASFSEHHSGPENAVEKEPLAEASGAPGGAPRRASGAFRR